MKRFLQCMLLILVSGPLLFAQETRRDLTARSRGGGGGAREAARERARVSPPTDRIPQRGSGRRLRPERDTEDLYLQDEYLQGDDGEKEEYAAARARETLPIPTVPSSEPCWILPSISAFVFAGGITLGYFAGSRGNRKAVLQHNFFCTFKRTEEVASLGWIAPEADALLNVEAELYAPDQSLYSKATLNSAGAPPAIPSLGGKGNPSLQGTYTVVFTALNSFTAGPNGRNIGGILYQGMPLFTEALVPGQTYPEGYQAKIEILYQGPELQPPFERSA